MPGTRGCESGFYGKNFREIIQKREARQETGFLELVHFLSAKKTTEIGSKLSPRVPGDDGDNKRVDVTRAESHWMLMSWVSSSSQSREKVARFFRELGRTEERKMKSEKFKNGKWQAIPEN